MSGTVQGMARSRITLSYKCGVKGEHEADTVMTEERRKVGRGEGRERGDVLRLKEEG